MDWASIASLVVAAGAFAGFCRQWFKDRKTKEQDFAAVVNQRLSSLLEGYSAVFDEYEGRARELLARIAILTSERNELAERVKELEAQVTDLKRGAAEDRATIQNLKAQVTKLERRRVDRGEK